MTILNVEALCNNALRAIGVKRQINWIYEGSPPARACLELYSQTRDELMMEEDWPFALREAILLPVSSVTAPAPWLGEYTYPSDALRIRYVSPQASLLGADPFDPQPVLFEPYNDNRGASPILTILSSLAPTAEGPVAAYIGRVTNPAQWQSDFAEAFIAQLAAKLPLALVQNLDVARSAATAAEFTRDRAKMVDDSTPPSLLRSAVPQQPQGGQRGG